MNITIDSAAAACALPADCAPDVPVEKPTGPEKHFIAAEGTEIKMIGTKTLTHAFLDGSADKLKWNVMEKVRKPLGAVSAMVKAKNRVVFQPEEYGGCYIEKLQTSTPKLKPKGRAKKVFERNGVYELPSWIVPHKPGTQRLATIQEEKNSPNQWQEVSP